MKNMCLVYYEVTWMCDIPLKMNFHKSDAGFGHVVSCL